MKIRGTTITTPMSPEMAVVKCQNLTDEQKAQARANIGAADKTEVDALDSTLLERVNPCVIDENTPMENGYLDSNGVFIENTGKYHATDFIELEQGVKYIGEVSCVADGSINTVPRSVRFYNADKVFTRTLSIPSGWDNIVLKNDEKYIRLDVKYDDGTLEYLRVYPELKGYKDILTLNKDIGVPQISIVEEELEGIRKGYDGTIYETAGEAVRAQIHEVSNDVLELCTKEKWNLAEDATIEYKKRCVSQWQTIGEPITTATDKACFIVVLDVSALHGKGLHFISEKYANAYSGNGYNGKIASYHICFADADGNFIGGKSYPQPGINGYIVPDNAKSCYITFSTTDDLEVADDLSNIGYYWVTAKGQDEHFDILTLNPEMKVPQLDEEISRVYKDLGGEQVHAPYIHARRPVIAFIFDGDYNMNAEMESVFYNHGVMVGFAPQYTTNFANNSKQTYLDWQEKGHEILAHSSVVLDETTTYTDEEAAEIIKASHATLTGYGFKVHGLIGSHGAIAERFLPTVKAVYDYAATKNNHSASYTYSELASESCLFFATDSPYKLWRYGMSDATLEQLKEAVDRAISQCGLLLFYDHASTTYWDEAGIAKLGDLIAYIKEKNVSVKTPYEAIKDYYSIRYEDIIN